MYTLGGGVDPERGWGHRDETWHAKEELARYGVQPDWFQLGDRDLGTHLVRTQMLRAGYPLSQITTALCDRWQPGARLVPASDDRCETHVVITDPADDSRRAIHFQEWWVRYRAQVPTHSFAFVGAEKASATTEAVAGHRRRRRHLAGAVQSGGEHRRDPGRPRHPRRAAGGHRPGRRLLADHRRKAIARHGR